MYLIFTILFSCYILVSQSASVLFEHRQEVSYKSAGRVINTGLQHIYRHSDDNYIFVTNKWGAIFYYQIETNYKLKLIQQFEVKGGTVRYLAEQNKYLYVADEINGIQIFKKDNNNFNYVGKKSTYDEATWICSDGDKLFVTLGSAGIKSYSITDPEKPEELKAVKKGQWYWYSAIFNGKLFVADKNKGVDIYDTNTLEIVGTYAMTLGQIRSFIVKDNYLIIAAGGGGIHIVDISDISKPTLFKKIDIPSKKSSFIYSLAIIDKFLYASDEQNALYMFDITDINKIEQIDNKAWEQSILDIVSVDNRILVTSNQNIEVFRHNDSPHLKAINDVQFSENETISIQVEASDKNNDSLYFSIENLPVGSAFDEKNRLIKWLPSFDQSGVYDNIVVKVMDKKIGGLSDSKSFKMTINHVNRAPRLIKINDSKVNENELLTLKLPMAEDDDVEDKGKLRYTFKELPVGAVFDESSMSLTWTPSFIQSGKYALSFVAEDSYAVKAESNFFIQVVHVDRAPIVDALSDITIKENEFMKYPFVAYDPDKEDSNRVQINVLKLPAAASFEKSSQSIQWTPSYEQSGVYTIDVSIKSGDKSDLKSFKVSVENVNRNPYFKNFIDSYTVKENAILSFTLSVFDDDKDDQTSLTVSADKLPDGATFDAAKRIFSWLPNFDQSGSYSIEFKVTDAKAGFKVDTVGIVVSHVNRAPSIHEISAQSIDENKELTLRLTGSDPDKEDQNKLVFSLENLPNTAVFDPQTSAIKWTPGFEESGKYTIKAIITDGLIPQSQNFQITVNHVNRTPIISEIPRAEVNEMSNFTYKIDVNDPDKEDKGKLKVTAENLPVGATFNPQNLLFAWKADYEQSGEYTITFTVADPSGLSAKNNLILTVKHVNRAPKFGILIAQTIDEDATLQYELPISDPDKEDTGKLTVTCDNLPENARIESNILIWKPDFAQAASYTLNLSVKDPDGLEAKASLKVKVNDKNRIPVIADISNVSLKEGEELKLDINIKDPDSDNSLKSIMTSKKKQIKFENNQILFNPSFSDAGIYDVKIAVNDGKGGKNEKTFTIIVENVNRPPSVKEITPVIIKKGQIAKFSIKATDDDKDKITYSATNLPKGASLSGNNFSWKTKAEDVGNHTITFTVSDGTDSMDIQVQITVNAE